MELRSPSRAMTLDKYSPTLTALLRICLPPVLSPELSNTALTRPISEATRLEGEITASTVFSELS